MWSFFILANQSQKLSLYSFLEPTDCIYFLCFVIDSYERIPVSYWLKSLRPNSPINHSHGTKDARGCCSFFFFSARRQTRNVFFLPTRRKKISCHPGYSHGCFSCCCVFSFFYPGNIIRNFSIITQVIIEIRALSLAKNVVIFRFIQ